MSELDQEPSGKGLVLATSACQFLAWAQELLGHS